MKTIILDTNFLLIPSLYNVDIFAEIDRILDDEYRIAVVSGTLHELEKIKEKKDLKYRKAADIGYKLIKAKDLLILHQNQGYVDDILCSISDKDTIVATQDSELKSRLLKKNIPVIILRQKRYLELINDVL